MTRMNDTAEDEQKCRMEISTWDVTSEENGTDLASIGTRMETVLDMVEIGILG